MNCSLLGTSAPNDLQNTKLKFGHEVAENLYIWRGENIITRGIRNKKMN